MTDEPNIINLEVVTLEQAKARGLKRYFTGEPCCNGHMSERSVRARSCLKCASVRELRRRIEHPEKYKHRYRSYQERGAERVKEAGRRWKAANRELVAARQKQRTKLLKETNPKKLWVMTVYCGARNRAQKKGIPFNITREYLLSMCVDVCPALNIPLIYSRSADVGVFGQSASIDRIVPSAGYVFGNIAVISHRANTIKGDATPEELISVSVWSSGAIAAPIHP